MMNPELKQKWVDALTSGTYRQGRRALRDNDDCFCCLGVLCDIVDPGGWEKTPGSIYSYFIEDGEDNDSVIPDPLREKLGLSLKDQQDLIDMNDEANRSFEEIAAFIAQTSHF